MVEHGVRWRRLLEPIEAIKVSDQASIVLSDQPSQICSATGVFWERWQQRHNAGLVVPGAEGSRSDSPPRA